MAITLYTVRHEQSEFNARNLITGNADPDLTPQGLQNAREIGELIQNWSIDKGMTGTLLRQRRTIEAMVGSRGLEIDYDAKMDERGLGRYQGVPYEKVDTEGKSVQTYLILKDNLNDKSNPHILKKEDSGESIPHVKRRIKLWLGRKIWAPGAPGDHRYFMVVSELWNCYFVNELFNNQGDRLGLCRLDNGYYSQYTIHYPKDPEKRIIVLERANVPIKKG